MDSPPTPKTPSGGRGGRRAVLAFGLTSFFSDLAHEAASAILPVFLAGLGAPPLGLGLVEGTSDAASAFVKLKAGRIADSLRRLKPATAAGYLLTGFAIPAIAAATAWWHVLVLRTAAWMGRGFRSPLRDTLLVRAVPEDRRGAAFGLERAMDQTGALLAPLAVVALAALGLHESRILILTLIPGLLAPLCLGLLVRESPRPAAAAAPTGAAPAISPPAGDLRRLLEALLVFGSGDFAKTLLVLWSLGDQAAFDAATLTTGAFLYAGFNGVTVVAAAAGGRLSDTLGRRPVLLFGYVAGTAAAVVPVLCPPSLAAGAIALLLSGILVGIEESVERAWASDLVPGGRRGRAFGLVHATNGIGDLIASALVGILWTAIGPRPAFGVAALLMAAGCVLTARLRSAPAFSREGPVA